MIGLSKLLRRIERIGTIARIHGPADIVRKLRWHLRGARAYRRRKAAEDDNFDAPGYDTGGIQRLYDLEIDSGNQSAGCNHLAVPPKDFHAAIAAIDLPIEDLTFIDLGSGKGRAVLLAADFPFRRIVGVEFAAALHRTASTNVAVRARIHGIDDRIDLRNADVTTIDFPETSLLIFLFNPFDPPVLTDVAIRSLASWRERPRPMRVLYLNPVHVQEWISAGWTLLHLGSGRAILGPPDA